MSLLKYKLPWDTYSNGGESDYNISMNFNKLQQLKEWVNKSNDQLPGLLYLFTYYNNDIDATLHCDNIVKSVSASISS